MKSLKINNNVFCILLVIILVIVIVSNLRNKENYQDNMMSEEEIQNMYSNMKNPNYGHRGNYYNAREKRDREIDYYNSQETDYNKMMQQMNNWNINKQKNKELEEKQTQCLLDNNKILSDDDINCIKCDPGYYGINGKYCEWYDDYCENGKIAKPEYRTQDNHCGSCNKGYKLSKDTKECLEKYGGNCSNGSLVKVESRSKDNHCGSCNTGYKLDDKKCVVKYGGSCSNGSLVNIKSRTKNNHCGSCNKGYKLDDKKCNKVVCESGYYVDDKKCKAFDCETGPEQGCASCVGQTKRTSNADCAMCNDGYYLDGKRCKAFGGKCANGSLMIAQEKRLQENHCVSCNYGYKLKDKKCNKVVCESGYYLDDKKCKSFDCDVGPEQGCASCVGQTKRTSNADCAMCNDGYYLDGKKCKPFL